MNIKSILAVVALIVTCISCESPNRVNQKKSDELAVVRGQQLQTMLRFLNPGTVATSITITNVDFNDDGSEKYEVFLTPGKHVLNLVCAYQAANDGHLKTESGTTNIEVNGGETYQLVIETMLTKPCNVLLKKIP